MKIGIVTATLKGGAGIAALRLHNSFMKQGIDSILINERHHDPTRQIYSSDSILYSSFFTRLLRRIRRKKIFKKYVLPFISTDISFSLFSLPFSENELHKMELLQECDVLNLHWISGYLDLPSFLANINSPVFFTLHDTNYFTAGCHYFNNCMNFKYNCNLCPIIEPNRQDKLNSVFKLKKEMFDHRKHFVIGISKWIAEAAQKSSLMKNLITTNIPNSFVPVLPKKNKKLLEYKKDRKKFALVIAQHLNDERKGWKFIEEIIDRNIYPELTWIVVGKGDIKNNANCIHLGQIKSSNELASIYSMVDLMVHPAIQDNFPNTIVESLCYGTPVVAFENSGMVDLINSENGLLAKKTDTNSLSNSIGLLLRNIEDYDRIAIKNNARLNFSSDSQSTQYIEFFKNYGLNE